MEKKTEKEIETTNYRPYPEADDAVVFPTLADSELAVLAALGTRRPVAVGEYLYREGDPTYDFYVILSGVVEVAVHSDGEERIITRQGPGRFLGELNLLTGERVYLSARVAQPGEVLVVPRAALQHVIATNPGLSDIILTAFLARRSGLLRGARAAIRVVGPASRPRCCGSGSSWLATASPTSGWTPSATRRLSGSCASSPSHRASCQS